MSRKQRKGKGQEEMDRVAAADTAFMGNHKEPTVAEGALS